MNIMQSFLLTVATFVSVHFTIDFHFYCLQEIRTAIAIALELSLFCLNKSLIDCNATIAICNSRRSRQYSVLETIQVNPSKYRSFGRDSKANNHIFV